MGDRSNVDLDVDGFDAFTAPGAGFFEIPAPKLVVPDVDATGEAKVEWPTAAMVIQCV